MAFRRDCLEGIRSGIWREILLSVGDPISLAIFLSIVSHLMTNALLIDRSPLIMPMISMSRFLSDSRRSFRYIVSTKSTCGKNSLRVGLYGGVSATSQFPSSIVLSSTSFLEGCHLDSHQNSTSRLSAFNFMAVFLSFRTHISSSQPVGTSWIPRSHRLHNLIPPCPRTTRDRLDPSGQEILLLDRPNEFSQDGSDRVISQAQDRGRGRGRPIG